MVNLYGQNLDRRAVAERADRTILYTGAAERDLPAICLATDDPAEGRAAFKEKPAPMSRRR